MSKIESNRLIEFEYRKVLLAFLGRGVTEFTDRIYVLAHLPHVRDILFLGSAASLDPKVRTGDINVPKAALPLENVSELLVDVTRAPPKADPELWRMISSFAQEVKTNAYAKLHATVPLFYMETRDLLEFLRDCGVSTIDMEISALFRIARYYGKRAAAVVRVADMPLEGLHYLSEEYEHLKKNHKERALEALFDIFVRFLGIPEGGFKSKTV